MALQFNPPDDLIRRYLDRPSPGQEASAGIQQALQLYAQQKALQQQQALAQEQRDIEMAKGIGEGGQDFTNTLGQIKAQRMAPTSPTSQGPSLIDRWKSLLGAAPVGKTPADVPGNVPPVPSTGTLPGVQPLIPGTPPQGPAVSDSFMTAEGELDQPSLDAYKKQHGTKGLAQIEKQLSLSNTLHSAYDRSQPQSVMTQKEALAAGKVDPRTRILSDENKSETRSERLGSSLRKELTSSKPYERLTSAKTAADNIAQAAKDPGAYGDLATLFDYMKALDPTSVVREGEQETFRKTGSFTQSMANSMSRLVNGQSITPEQRQEIVKYTQNRLKTAHNVYKNHSEPTLRQAKRIGADPLEVDPFYGQDFEHLIGADEPAAPKSALMHLSTKELQDLRKKLTVHKSNGN